MRLTERIDKDHIMTHHYRDGKYRPTNFHTKIECYNKLGQLEDIEEELGIDLITLFKALKDGFYYTKPHLISISKLKYKHEIYHTDTEAKELRKCNLGWCIGFINEKSKVELIPLKCYGKTWALTKEELL